MFLFRMTCFDLRRRLRPGSVLSLCEKLWFWVQTRGINPDASILLFLGESEAVFRVGIFLRMVTCFLLVLYSNR